MAEEKRPVAQRQKMINLMYVCLMAMLAINVSSEVLDGFNRVDESLTKTTENIQDDNLTLYKQMEYQYHNNPTKVSEWYGKSQNVRSSCDTLFAFLESIKEEIVREADGKDGNVHDITNREDLESAAQVMLNPISGKGTELRLAIEKFRKEMATMMEDDAKRRILEENFSTTVPEKVIIEKSWEEYMFEDMPVAAVVTMLSKLQSDIRHAEHAVLNNLLTRIDKKDMRVNDLQAFVIPETRTVVRGSAFRAKVVMAAIDTTQAPRIFLADGREVDNSSGTGQYETWCNTSGNYEMKGYLTAIDGDGNTVERYFSMPYQVIDPTATVSLTMMNTMYAGYDNPITVSIPGVALSDMSVACSGGAITPKGGGNYIVRPSRVGQEVTITVTSNISGRSQTMGSYSYKVRQLPDPTAHMTITDADGNKVRYKGGVIARSSILSCKGLEAAIDDGMLDVTYKVLSFETVVFDNMGNAVPMASDGASFSQRQRDAFSKMERNKRFYISNVRSTGPDGIERRLPASMEIIIR